MRFLLPLLLLVAVFERKASADFLYELLYGKVEHVEEMLVKMQNETGLQEERIMNEILQESIERQKEHSQILQAVAELKERTESTTVCDEKFYEKMEYLDEKLDKAQDEAIRQEERIKNDINQESIQRHKEHSEILQSVAVLNDRIELGLGTSCDEQFYGKMENLDEKLDTLRNETIRQEDRITNEIFKESNKILQTVTGLDDRLELISVSDEEIHRKVGRLDEKLDKLQTGTAQQEERIKSEISQGTSKIIQKVTELSDRIGHNTAGGDEISGKLKHLDEKLGSMQNEASRQEQRLTNEISSGTSNISQKVTDLNSRMDTMKASHDDILKKIGYLDDKLIKLQNEATRQTGKINDLLQIVTEQNDPTKPITSCDQAKGSRRYNMTASNRVFEVFCEQEMYGGGWVVIQNRFEGTENFYRNWVEYQNGFGNLMIEFWLGLEKIYWLTSSRDYELLVHMENFYGEVKYARYPKFEIGSAQEKYVLKPMLACTGTAGNSMDFSENQKFSTYDQNNDAYASSCAKDHHSGWWFRGGTYSNLNGVRQDKVERQSNYWDTFTGWRGLKVSKMMIRPI